MEQDRAYWLAWSQIKGIGAISLKKISQHFGSLKEAWNAPAIAFAEVEGLNNKFFTAIQQRKHHPEELLIQHSAQNPQFWTPADPAYPRLLLEIPSPPPLLYYLGQVEPAENQGIKPMIAIVGTRNPTEYGKRWTKKITQALVSHGFGIVSGMAAGIDTVAHHSCLAANGRTIAVLGTGVDTVYPYSNRDLYQKLKTQGLIVSEYPAKTQPDRGHFPARNRIIAGLCRAVVIMEAPKRSGALITARFANDFGRDVYVLPGSLDNVQSLGCLALLNSGAHVLLGIEHLLELLGTMPCLEHIPPAAESKPKVDLEPDLERIYSLISRESIPIDSIVEQTELNTSETLVALSQLELMDLIVQLPGMRYQIKE
ncbi:DNA-protecting protein DprA [Pleurocapsales cyanobacterium LEGE 10410]|nr:DNA-protecting protein DprA [Pleurocapsales cyanobacterium LEGE 10410]